MTTARFALVMCLGALAISFPAGRAAAQRVELAGKVTASRTVLTQRRVGEARYLALSDLFYRGHTAYLEVLDLATQAVIQVKAKRSLLEHRFGTHRDGSVMVPQGEIALYRDGIIGVALSETAVAPGQARHYWYAELDASSGKLVRSVALATLRDGDQLQTVGADASGDAAWFALTEGGPGNRELILRRLDLGSLEARDVQRIGLSARTATGREHAVRVHASADLSRFAIVEYVEDGVPMAPGQIFFAVPATGGAFAVPAPPTTYGVAFSADGKYAFLGSAQRGTISRVDMVAGRVDKQVAAPRYLHHLVISPSGTKLFAFASSSRYAAYDLPDLKPHGDAAHPTGVSAAMQQLHGDGIASIDGAFFVVPDAEDRHSAQGNERTYVIARLIE